MKWKSSIRVQEQEKSKMNTKCLKCGKEVKDYEPEYCCDGTECGCMGKPIEPPLCEKCWKEIMN